MPATLMRGDSGSAVGDLMTGSVVLRAKGDSDARREIADAEGSRSICG